MPHPKESSPLPARIVAIGALIVLVIVLVLIVFWAL
jgi:hypothetical protein